MRRQPLTASALALFGLLAWHPAEASKPPKRYAAPLSPELIESYLFCSGEVSSASARAEAEVPGRTRSDAMARQRLRTAAVGEVLQRCGFAGHEVSWRIVSISISAGLGRDERPLDGVLDRADSDGELVETEPERRKVLAGNRALVGRYKARLTAVHAGQPDPHPGTADARAPRPKKPDTAAANLRLDEVDVEKGEIGTTLAYTIRNTGPHTFRKVEVECTGLDGAGRSGRSDTSWIYDLGPRAAGSGSVFFSVKDQPEQPERGTCRIVKAQPKRRL
jgi:hypothetical protein